MSIFFIMVIGLMSLYLSGVIGFRYGYDKGFAAGMKETSTKRVIESNEHLVSMATTALEMTRQSDRITVAQQNNRLDVVAGDPPLVPQAEPEDQPKSTQQAANDVRNSFGNPAFRVPAPQSFDGSFQVPTTSM